MRWRTWGIAVAWLAACGGSDAGSDGTNATVDAGGPGDGSDASLVDGGSSDSGAQPCTTSTQCTNPPATTCASPAALRTFAAVGTCVGGVCQYSSTDAACAGGCIAAACACEPGPFTNESIPTRNNQVNTFDFVVDAAGNLHVVYDDFGTANTVSYTRRDTSGTWTTDTTTPPVEAPPGGANYPSLAIDDSGGLHVCYVRGPNVKYGYFAPNATAWTTSIVAPADASKTAIAVDHSGGVACAYVSSSGGVGYAYRPAGGAFVTGTGGSLVKDLALGFDPASKLHGIVASRATPSSVVTYDVPIPATDAGWSGAATVEQEPADAGSDDDDVVSFLAMDDAGAMRAGFQNATNGNFNVMFASREPGAVWKTVAAAQGGAPAFAEDALGRVHLAYERYGVNAGLWYTFTPPGGAWTPGVKIAAQGSWSSVMKLRVTAKGAWVVYEPGTAVDSHLALAYDSCK